VFNFGSGRSLSINELARHVVAAFGFAPGEYEIRHAALRPGEQRRVQADISRARSVLGWEPRTPFEVGLAETVWQARAEFAAQSEIATAAEAL
jgi:nucleoside-diphosphate-sugar epimerase